MPSATIEIDQLFGLVQAVLRQHGDDVEVDAFALRSRRMPAIVLSNVPRPERVTPVQVVQRCGPSMLTPSWTSILAESRTIPA